MRGFSTFNASQKIKGPEATPHGICNLERSTHGVEEVSRILKAVPIVVYREGEAVVDCLLEERAGTGTRQNPGGSSEPAWKADGGARGAEWPLSKLHPSPETGELHRRVRSAQG